MGNSQGGIIAQADPPDSCNSGVMASIVDGSMQLEALSNSSTAAYIPTDAKCVFFHVDVDHGLLDRTSLKGTSVLSCEKSEHFASQNGGIPLNFVPNSQMVSECQIIGVKYHTRVQVHITSYVFLE